MSKNLKSIFIISIVLMLTVVSVFAFIRPFSDQNTIKIKSGDISMYENAEIIKLDKDKASIGDNIVPEYDYMWHVDPTIVHNDIKNAPAEYYTGSLPNELPNVYIDHELFYFPKLDIKSFQLIDYAGENEWAYYYKDGINDNYIFATLFNYGNEIQSQMMYSEEEALKNKVIHITKAGTYILEGSWNGQIYVDLGDKDETFIDESASVTLILNGANIKCTVAPGIIFYSVYECDNSWEQHEYHLESVDTSSAGANIIIPDGSVSFVDGKNVGRMLKTKYKSEESGDSVPVQKKLRKIDAALYSYVSLNINGGKESTGKLYIYSGFEGLSSELHMSMNGGNIIINSYDDGINLNEDDVSTFMMNGGSLELNVSIGPEGDGIDTNGFAIINGGTLYINNAKYPDGAVDSSKGIECNGGTIYVDGKLFEYKKGQYFQEIYNEW